MRAQRKYSTMMLCTFGAVTLIECASSVYPTLLYPSFKVRVPIEIGSPLGKALAFLWFSVTSWKCPGLLVDIWLSYGNRLLIQVQNSRRTLLTEQKHLLLSSKLFLLSFSFWPFKKKVVSFCLPIELVLFSLLVMETSFPCLMLIWWCRSMYAKDLRWRTVTAWPTY